MVVFSSRARSHPPASLSRRRFPEVLTVRVSTATVDRLRVAARLEDRTVGALVRRLLDSHAAIAPTVSRRGRC